MTSLIEQLQADALNGSAPITDLLRKAKTAAAKLKAEGFSAWIELELTGYPAGVAGPEYRRVPAELKFHNPFHGWRPIIGSSHQLRCWQPVSEIVSILEGEGSVFTVNVSAKATAHFSKQIGFAAEVRSFASCSALAAIVDVVRNTVLDWALKPEDAGVRGDGLSFSKADADRARAVTINIGSIGNAVGLGSFGDHAAITATQTLTGADLAAAVQALINQLDRVLPASDLPASIKVGAESALNELREAANAAPTDTGRLRRGLESLKRVTEHAAGHTIAAGLLATIAQIHRAL